MTAIYRFPIVNAIRLSHRLSLIFFALVCFANCRQSDQEVIKVVFTNKQATGIAVPNRLIRDGNPDSINQLLQVSMENNPGAMLGNYSRHHDYILFNPLIPLSPGYHYSIYFRRQLIGKVFVPADTAARAPLLLAVHPAPDTLPANLLKFYLQFSAPMREGESLNHVTLLDSNRDTVPNVFLDLQPELWNVERTVLTLWLDPGRIKRDLIPNLEMGNPLQTGHLYTLVVANKWKDAQGLPLERPYEKNFIVGPRDSISPRPGQWKLSAPRAGTRQPLQLYTGEDLDYYLQQETMRVLTNEGNVVKCQIVASAKKAFIAFVPADPWLPGHYRLQVDAHLEDFAGNNIKRPFDRDILKMDTVAGRDVTEIRFVIEGRPK